MPEMPLPLGPATQAEIYVGGADELPLDPDEWESRAKTILDPGPFDYIAGGAGGESTMQANRDAFTRWQLRPAVLAGNQQRDLHVNQLLDAMTRSPLSISCGRVAHVTGRGRGQGSNAGLHEPPPRRRRPC